MPRVVGAAEFSVGRIPLSRDEAPETMEAMSATATQIIVALATVLFGGVVSAIVQGWIASRKARKELRQQKLEELFLATNRFCNMLTTHNLPMLRAMEGKIMYDEAKELEIKNVDKQDNSFEIMRMLVNIYFPELSPQFKNIVDRRGRINEVRTKPNANQFRQELLGIDDDQKQLDEGIIRLTHRHR